MAERTRIVGSEVSQERALLQFFGLVFALAVPFWLFGRKKLPLPVNLPATALGTFVPAIAAAVVTHRQRGPDGVKELLGRTLDYQKVANKAWYLPTLLLMPSIYSASYGVLRLARLPLPERIRIPFKEAPAFFVIFFVGDAGEELGWSGYAIDPMQERWGALKASLILGSIWAVWHAIPYVQTGNPPRWVVWQTLSLIPARMLTVWIYNNTGKSVFTTTLFHDITNLSWSLFPNYGSHYNPFVTNLITSVVAAIVAFAWEPKTLARLRRARLSQA
jgi:membrane protease YdiL (CAAX protease family)